MSPPRPLSSRGRQRYTRERIHAPEGLAWRSAPPAEAAPAHLNARTNASGSLERRHRRLHRFPTKPSRRRRVVDSLGNTATRNITVTPSSASRRHALLAPRRAPCRLGRRSAGFTWSLTTKRRRVHRLDDRHTLRAPPRTSADIARVTDSLRNVASLTIVVTRVTVDPSSVSSRRVARHLQRLR
jgi:hypothetical protein